MTVTVNQAGNTVSSTDADNKGAVSPVVPVVVSLGSTGASVSCSQLGQTPYGSNFTCDANRTSGPSGGNFS